MIQDCIVIFRLFRYRKLSIYDNQGWTMIRLYEPDYKITNIYIY